MGVFVAAVIWVAAADLRACVSDVIGAKQSKVYHTHPDACGAAKTINPENRILFGSAEEAVKTGRRLCKRCAAAGASGKEPGKANAQPRGRSATTRPARVPDGLAGDPPETTRVAGVLPGGTIELETGDKALLSGVACAQPGHPLAEDVVRFITEQTRGRTVRLTCDVPQGPSGRRDALGRLLVYLVPEPDGRDLGGELVFQGYAWLDRTARFDHRAEYARREDEAWRARRGIWRPLKGAAGKRKVVTGRHAHHYHDRTCPHVAHLSGKITMTVNEAKTRRLPPCPYYRVKTAGDEKVQKPRNPG